MKYVTVSELTAARLLFRESFQEEQDIVVTRYGKPIALILPVGAQSLESTLSAVRIARAECAGRQMREASLQNGLNRMSLEEIEAEIRRVREHGDI